MFFGLFGCVSLRRPHLILLFKNVCVIWPRIIAFLLCLWFHQGSSWRSKSSKRKGFWAQTAQARASCSSSWEAEAGISKETTRELEICCIKFRADMISQRLGSLFFYCSCWYFRLKHVEVCWTAQLWKIQFWYIHFIKHSMYLSFLWFLLVNS